MKKITFLSLLLMSGIAFAQPTNAPTVPTQAQADVVSIFSDAYTSAASLSLASFTPSGNTATISTQAGNDVYEFLYTVDNSGGEFVGFDLSNAIDLTNMENLHYDIWIGGTTDVGAVFNTTVSNHSGGHLSGQTEGYVHTNPVAQGQEGQWLSFDIPFNTFAPDMSVNPRDIISQLVFTMGSISDGAPVYIDNIYFWRTAVNPVADASLSDLQLDGSTVTGFSSNTLTYNIELANGTPSVPQITSATTTNALATTTITQGTLPFPTSATVDVTSEDSSTMQTYTINFTEAPLAPTTDAPEFPSTGTDLYVYSGLSGSSVSNFNFIAFQGGGTYSEIDIEGNGNNAGRMQGITFYGAEWDAVDVSSFNYIHINYFATTSTNFNFYLIDQTAGIGGGAAEEPRYRFGNNGSGEDIPIVTGSWQSVFIPLTAFTNWPTGGFSYDLNDIFQWKFDGNGEVYFDNIYFSTTNTLSTDNFTLENFKVAPNPTNRAWSVSSQQIINSISVFDVLGKNIVTLRPQSNEAKIDASSLKPGIYIARIEGTNGSQTIKLVRE